MKPALLVLLLAPALAAGDREFDSLVRGVENDYNVRHTRIPFFGIANFFVKVIRPAGARDIRLAVFENFRAPDFTGRMGPEWRPFIRVTSRHGRETTVIYANTGGKHLKLLITNLEPHETVMLQVRLDQRRFEEWVREPVRKVTPARRY